MYSCWFAIRQCIWQSILFCAFLGKPLARDAVQCDLLCFDFLDGEHPTP